MLVDLEPLAQSHNSFFCNFSLKYYLHCTLRVNPLDFTGNPKKGWHQDINRSGILIAKMSTPKEIVQQTAERNIIASARGEGVRISIRIFNNEEDVDKRNDALKEMLNS